MLEWIEQYGGNGAFYDIGANIGIYSLYYAKKFQNGNVYSFEPSVFNLRQLAKNISANALSDKITIINNPETASDPVVEPEPEPISETPTETLVDQPDEYISELPTTSLLQE